MKGVPERTPVEGSIRTEFGNPDLLHANGAVPPLADMAKL